MKGILIGLVWLVSLFGFAQQRSLYTNELPTKPSDFIQNSYLVTFKRTMYRLTFNDDTPKFLKPMLIRFMEKRHRNYTGFGIYKVNVIKKNDVYYLVEREAPRKLILLK